MRHRRYRLWSTVNLKLIFYLRLASSASGLFQHRWSDIRNTWSRNHATKWNRLRQNVRSLMSDLLASCVKARLAVPVIHHVFSFSALLWDGVNEEFCDETRPLFRLSAIIENDMSRRRGRSCFLWKTRTMLLDWHISPLSSVSAAAEVRSKFVALSSQCDFGQWRKHRESCDAMTDTGEQEHLFNLNTIVLCLW